MHTPLVTVGVPVYRGQDTLPALLECLRTQTYQHIEVLISVDAADQASAEVCKPFLEHDHRFRMHVQLTRLGWAGNTGWTMRHRRGDFYIYQQHDDLISPTYIADLVSAATRWPDAVICFSKVRYTGRRQGEISCPPLLGDSKSRVLEYLSRLDWIPFRGLIRGSALDKTSGLLLSDFDPFDSYGTEMRFMAELALLGEFRFVEGPTYFKNMHGENLSAKRAGWSIEHLVAARACLAAWMIEVIAPAGKSVRENRHLFRVTLERFAVRRLPSKWIPTAYDWLRRRTDTEALRTVWNGLKRSVPLRRAVTSLVRSGRFNAARPALMRQIFERLEKDGRFVPSECLDMTWEALEAETFRRYRVDRF